MMVSLFGDWDGADIEKLESDFGDYEKPVTGHFNGDTVVGIYTYENYSGDAIGYVRRGSDVFEFTGGHCSCHGLEGQQELTKVTAAYIREQLKTGKLAPYETGKDKWRNPDHNPKQWDRFRKAVIAMLDEIGGEA